VRIAWRRADAAYRSRRQIRVAQILVLAKTPLDARALMPSIRENSASDPASALAIKAL